MLAPHSIDARKTHSDVHAVGSHCLIPGAALHIHVNHGGGSFSSALLKHFSLPAPQAPPQALPRMK